MCRVLAYLGQPIELAHVLFATDNALVRQSHEPRMTSMLNLAGFGLAAWDPRSPHPGEPLVYRSMALPMFDSNLASLGHKLAPSCAIAHVRGVALDSRERLSATNLHPFQMQDSAVVFAHNGHLREFERMRFALIPYIHPAVLSRIDGTSDSAWLHALFLSQLDDPRALPSRDQLCDAIVRTLEIVREVRAAHAIETSSPVNLFVATGETIVATRFSFDYGWYPAADALLEVDLPFASLWFTFGTAYRAGEGEWMMSGDGPCRSLLAASEPLTADSSTWLEVPEYAMLAATRAGDEVEWELCDLTV